MIRGSTRLPRFRGSLIKLLSITLLGAACAQPTATPTAAPAPAPAGQPPAASPTSPASAASPAAPASTAPTITASPVSPLASPKPETAAQAPAPVASPAASKRPSGPFQPRVETVASGLQVPWSLAFAPDGRLFLTERPGRIRVIQDGRLRDEPVATLPAATSAESGLMGLVLSPGFQQDGLMYVMYTYQAGAGGLRNRVSRLTLLDGRAGEEQILLDDIPGATIHDGGRVAFGPDGKLYVTTGDAGNASLAQDRASLAGKILRLNPDGSIPQDNPFPGSPVYTLGHRNPEGLAWHPGTQQLYATEHGPTGNDEVNVIQAGQNYGWPEVQGQAGGNRFTDPILVFSPAVAPAGAAFYSGDPLAPWRNNFFFATLRGQHLHRVVLSEDNPRQVENHERLFEGVYGRLRAVALGPDGYLYFTTSNRDGRGSPAPQDDRVLRIVPG